MIASHLQTIKSAGIYRFVFDKSEISSTLAQTLRLVVGYSEQGPFNTVTLINSIDDFKSVYGKGTRKMESRGVYFHRMAEQALLSGPILCLNIKNFEDETVEALSIDPTSTTHSKINAKVTEIYNTTRLWTLDPEVLTDIDNMDGFLNISHVDTDKVQRTIFLVPSESKDFDITLSDWYNTYTNDEIPEYMESYIDKKLSEYMVDSYVFAGKFDSTIAVSDTYKKYFDVDGSNVYVKPYITNSFGDKINTLDALSQLEGSGFLNKYTGSMIPYIKNIDNSYLALDLQMNLDMSVNKLMVYLNSDKLENATDVDSIIRLDNTASGLLGQIYQDPITSTFDIVINNGTDDTHIVYPLQSTTSLLIGDSLEINSANLTVTEINGDIITLNSAYTGLTNGDTITVTRTTGERYFKATPIDLSGYTFVNAKPTTNSMADKLTWQKSLIDSLVDYRGLHEALINKIDVDYRYLIDTFETYPDVEVKSIFSSLCKEKENAFAILNFPNMESFTKNDNFKTNGVFDMNLIASGGNGVNKFSLPTRENGGTFCAFYTECKLLENSLKKNVPSSALVSNLYMNKYTNLKPYNVVAGPTNGRLSLNILTGPDYNFSRNDLDILEPFGVNCLVYSKQYGTYINANQTASQKPLTSLSKINIRELVIFLQDEIADLLESYQWENNTISLREAVKLKADNICERIRLNGGLYAYSNQCDENNNTAEIIQNEMLILSTQIEPAFGAGKMVHELTIRKTGEINSTIS